MANPVGRPSSMTPEVVNKLEQAFAIDSTVIEACSYADISRETFYNWLEKNPKFNDRIQRLRQRPVLKARQTIVQNIEQPEHAKWYLERKVKKEFALRTEYTGKDGKDLLPQPILDVSQDDSDKKDNKALPKGKRDSGRNVSKQDGEHSDILNSISTE